MELTLIIINRSDMLQFRLSNHELEKGSAQKYGNSKHVETCRNMSNMTRTRIPNFLEMDCYEQMFRTKRIKKRKKVYEHYITDKYI